MYVNVSCKAVYARKLGRVCDCFWRCIRFQWMFLVCYRWGLCWVGFWEGSDPCRDQRRAAGWMERLQAVCFHGRMPSKFATPPHLFFNGDAICIVAGHHRLGNTTIASVIGESLPTKTAQNCPRKFFINCHPDILRKYGLLSQIWGIHHSHWWVATLKSSLD